MTKVGGDIPNASGPHIFQSWRVLVPFVQWWRKVENIGGSEIIGWAGGRYGMIWPRPTRGQHPQKIFVKILHFGAF